MVDSVSSLSSYFTNLVTSLMDIERQPLQRLQQKRDSLNITRAVYSDTSRGLKELRDSVRALISTQSGFALKAGRNIAVSNVASGFTVVNATASSSAISGTYQIDNIVLAKEHRVRGDRQASSDQALGLAGAMLLGGAAARSVTMAVNELPQTVSATGIAAPAARQTELGSGEYSLETRLNGSTYQFRLVDSDGNALSIQQGSQGSTTSEWQDITAGANYDSGRGLTIQFAGDPSGYQAGATRLNYQAQGVTVEIAAADSLNAIAAKINNAAYPAGQGIAASVVDRQLVLSAVMPGTRHLIQAQDLSADPAQQVLSRLGVLSAPGQFAHTLQAGDTDTTFTVNGQTVTRYQNSGISDVISGITLNFSPDAVGKSATITVSPNWNSARSSIDAFISKFNEIETYLTSKTSVTKKQDGEKVSFTRGALAGDQLLSELRSNLFGAFYTQATGAAYQYMHEIGLSINDSLEINVSNADKLEKAFNSDPEGVKNLMDQVMGRMDVLLTRFTGGDLDKGYLSNTLSSIDGQIKDLGDDITQKTERLNDRQAALTNQYAEIQAQLLMLSYSQQTWQSIYSSTSQYG